jgi:hypothetical protein
LESSKQFKKSISANRQETNSNSPLRNDVKKIETKVESNESHGESDAFTDMENNADILTVGGLSEEEVNDLDRLISGLKQKSSDMISENDIKEIPKQIRSIEKRLVRISEMVLKFDSSLKTLVELVSLFQSKSKIWNHRLKVIENHLKKNISS